MFSGSNSTALSYLEFIADHPALESVKKERENELTTPTQTVDDMKFLLNIISKKGKSKP